eukprot:16406749-Heterocapsa_arctica.AAC.1
MWTNCKWLKGINTRGELSCHQKVEKPGCMHILAQIEAEALGATHRVSKDNDSSNGGFHPTICK